MTTSETAASETAVASTYAHPLYAWFVVSVLALANCVSFIDRLILSLLVQPIKADLQISDTAFSLLAGAAFAIFYCGMGLVIARWADRYSRKWIITSGIVMWCTMTALAGTARSYAQLFLYRVGVGVGEATLSPSAYSMLAGYFPPQRLSLAIGVFSAGVTAGTGLAYLLGGATITWVMAQGTVSWPLIGELSGWRLTMVIIGLLGLPVALLMLLVREPARATRGEPASRAEILAHFTANRTRYGYVFAGYGATAITAFSVMTWTPALYQRQYGATAAEAAITIGTVALVGGLLGAFLGGGLADHLESRGDRPSRGLRAVDHPGAHACAIWCRVPIVARVGRRHARPVRRWLHHRLHTWRRIARRRIHGLGIGDRQPHRGLAAMARLQAGTWTALIRE
jgi:MFS family permease